MRVLSLFSVLAVACGGTSGPTSSVQAPSPRVAPPPAPAAAADAPIRVTIQPRPAYVEISDGAQLVNCDLVVENTSAATWTLAQLEVSVFDRAGKLAMRKFIDGSGVSPGIATVPNRALGANTKLLVLNPLFAFPRDIELGTLRFTVSYEQDAPAEASSQRRPALPTLPKEVSATVDVEPIVYVPRTALRLPVAGPLLVWDGHDFLSHHRRWDYLFPPIRELGFTSSVARYSYDFVPVDANGVMYAGDPANNASWFGFGKPIVAPAAGTVVAVVDTHADDRKFEMESLKADLMNVYGNYVVIDHGHGELSVFGHIQQRSAKVKRGERVVAGQPIAAIGASGSSLMPHLHYQLQTTADGHAEGLPSYFVDFQRLRGARRVDVARGQVDSGELIQAR